MLQKKLQEESPYMMDLLYKLELTTSQAFSLKDEKRNLNKN